MIAANATLFSALKLAGAAYLVYIGVKSLLSGGGFQFDATEANGDKNRATPFRDGLLCNVLNPKVTIFIMAIFSQLIELATPTFDKALYGAFLTLEVFVVWNLFVSFVRTRLVPGVIQKFQVTIDRVVGVLLIGFGGALALERAR